MRNYNSPITVMIEKIQNEMAQDIEEAVLQEIFKIGVKVDKDELIKLLNNDRDTYLRGYQDGISSVSDKIQEILHKEANYFYD